MNMPSPEQLKAWADSYLKGTISDSDKKALEAWYASLDETEVHWPAEGDSAEGLRSRMFEAIDQQIGSGNKKVHRIYWWPAATAAAVMALIVLTFFYRRPAPGKPAVARTEAAPVKDIQPGSTKASLLLADGKQMEISGQHLLKVAAMKEVVCGLVTQKGQQSPPLLLSDGTKVWLNAASAIHFPSNFTGKERVVTLSGEAYFEVAKDNAHPFVVKTDRNKVDVLGTHFDVMAYDDEPFTYATLLEGKIRVSNDHHSTLLEPGQQSKINADGGMRTETVEAEQYIAWMKGQLPLSSMDIKSFLREVSRWYDVEVVYEGEPPVLSFSGSLNKDVPISQLLAALNANGIHCRLEDKKVIVGH